MENVHPRTVAEVISAIDADLSHEAKNCLFETPLEKLFNLHFTFGMYVRNSFVYHNDNKAELALSCAKEVGAEDPQAAVENYLSMVDCYSSVLMRVYWKHLLMTFDPENPDHPLPLPASVAGEKLTANV
ncbi:MAG: hypothetical protein WCK89_15350 [bacterium]